MLSRILSDAQAPRRFERGKVVYILKLRLDTRVRDKYETEISGLLVSTYPNDIIFFHQYERSYTCGIWFL